MAFRASVDVPMLNTPSTLDRIQCLASVPALVSVMARYGAVPATWRFQFGVVVPMPTLPFASTEKSVVVAVPAVVEEMVRSGVLAVVFTVFEMERRA